MPDSDLNNPPADPMIGQKPLSHPQPLVPILLAILIAITGYLALALHGSIDSIDRRTLKIERALGAVSSAESPAKKPTEPAAAPDTRLADSLKDIEEEVAATRTQVDAIRESIADLQKITTKTKDSPPGGFVADETLVAQKGLLLKATAPASASSGGTRTWHATPSHDMLDLLLKISPGTSSQIITFVPKQKHQVRSIDVYDRNSKGTANKIADCQTDNMRLRCKLNASGPAVLQVIAKTQGDEPLDIELGPAS